MRKNIYLSFFFSIILNYCNAQLSISSGVTPQQLVNSILGQGITAYNITFTGDTTMEGTFSATGTNLGLSNGIILTSGHAQIAVGPNQFTSAAGQLSLPGDSILDIITAPILTEDAAVLEFDFIPQSSQVTFRYVFGSEEYPEFVCSQYNDVFAFFISGPGIVGNQNLALIPSTSIPVAINTVNVGTSGTSGSGSPSCDTTHTQYYVDNTNGTSIEYDGFTVPMTAVVNLQPCGHYHLRISIADAGDDNYDSGVFIEGGSLFSTPVVDAGIDQTICSGNVAQLGTVSSPGYSYNWIPATGLNNNQSATPSLTLTNNTNSPVNYTYVVVANSGTCLFNDTVVVTVDPAPVASFSISPSQVCIGQPVTINYTGAQAANYNWDFGSGSIVSGSGAGPYLVTFSTAGNADISVTAVNPGCQSSDTESVVINPGPIATFTNPPDACPGATVIISFTGTASQNANYTWDFHGGQVVSGSGAGPYQVNWTTSGQQDISLSIDDNGCIAPVTTNNIMIAPLPVVFAGNDASVCPTTPVPLGEAAQPGYLYQWNPATNLDDATISSPTASTPNSGLTSLVENYTVTITDPIGCTATDNVQVTIIPGIDVDFASTGVHCLPDNSIDFQIQGAYPAGATFAWDFGAGASPQTSTSSGQTGVTYSSTGLRTITLNASSGTCVMQPVMHDVEIFDVPAVDFSTTDLEGCSPLHVNLMNLSPDSTNNFNWIISGGTSMNSQDATVDLVNAGTYDVSLTATTINGCATTLARNRYITVYAQPVSLFATNPSVATIEAPVIFFQNNSTDADFYYWDLGDSTSSQLSNLSHVYSKTGTYTITLIARNSFGCIDTSTGTIEINEGFSFYVPNSFSPDGDGKNDYFQGYGINFKTYELSIFNRWGEKIYETNEYHKPWDGRIKDAVQNDVFVYKISVIDSFNEPHQYIGSVTVVR